MEEKETKENFFVKGAQEFKAFINRGNVVDMAVGVVMGSAFGSIINSFVDDLLMPIFGLLMGGKGVSDLSFRINNATIAYGAFIQTVLDFVIIAFCVFIMVKLFSKLRRPAKKEEVSQKSAEVELLEEIRDLLKKKK